MMSKPPRKSCVQSSFDNVIFLDLPSKAAGERRADAQKLDPRKRGDQQNDDHDAFVSNMPGKSPHSGRDRPAKRRKERDGLDLFRPGDIAPDGRSFEHCVDDLQKALALVERGDLPRLDLLDQAPILYDWAIIRALDNPEVLILSGLFQNHPTVADGRYGHTSPLIMLDGETPPTWARTWSRWYRLGEARSNSGGSGRGRLH